jgi:hypothetical protein
VQRKYSIKEGSKIPAKKAGVVGRALHAIRERRGKLTADVVVEEAKATKHPLHEFFDWNDRQAAQKYRLEQARHLMRSVYVIIEEVHSDPIRAVVAFEQDDDLCDYVPIVEALSNAQQRQQLLDDARDELKSWITRTAYLRKLAKARTLVRQAVKTI